MTFLFGTSIAGSLCLMMIMAGYLVAGFLPAENYLTRLALANLTGLAWLLFAASILGAFAQRFHGAGTKSLVEDTGADQRAVASRSSGAARQ